MAQRKPTISHNQDNNFALKWTLDEIEKALISVLEYLREDKNGTKTTYIGKVLWDIGLRDSINLYPEIWNYWEHTLEKPIGCTEEDESSKTREKRESVFKLHKNISNGIQARMIDRCLNSKSNPAMSIFILKNQGWSDTIDYTSGGEPIKQISGIDIKVLNTNPLVELDQHGNIINDQKKLTDNGE